MLIEILYRSILSARVLIEIRMQNMRLMHCHYNYQMNEIQIQPLNLCKKKQQLDIHIDKFVIVRIFHECWNVRMIPSALKCSTKRNNNRTDERTAFFTRQTNHKILKL